MPRCRGGGGTKGGKGLNLKSNSYQKERPLRGALFVSKDIGKRFSGVSPSRCRLESVKDLSLEEPRVRIFHTENWEMRIESENRWERSDGMRGSLGSGARRCFRFSYIG